MTQTTPHQMQVATAHRYGAPEVLTLETRPIPVPKPTEVLIRMHASNVTTGDWRLRAAAFPPGLKLIGRLVAGLFRPRHAIPGTTFAGDVVAVGSKVGRFQPGDRVYGITGHGAHAEYLVVPQDSAIALAPTALTPAEASSLPFGAATADHFLNRMGQMQPGDQVLITGASGAVGHVAVQIAKAQGARVTAVASGRNADFLRQMGADVVVDYTRTDIASLPDRFDLVFDTVGSLTFGHARKILRPGGRFLALNGGLREMRQMLAPWRRHGHRVKFGVSAPDAAQLQALAALADRGDLRPVIEDTFPLNQIAQAHAAVESRHRRGSIALVLHHPALREVAA